MAWLTGWNYRKSKTVNGSTAGIQTDYQMKLIVHKGPGTDTATDIYLGTNVRNDFGDVRFTTSDGSTLLNYWIESYILATSAIIWIKIPYIPASPSSANIYVYYDNPTAITLSNGLTTFIGYGDFNTDEGFTWIDQGIPESFGNNTGQLRSNNGHAEFVGASGAGKNDVYKSISSTYNFYYEAKVSYTSGSGNFEVLGISNSTATPYPATTKSIFAFIDTYPTHLTVYINANNGSGGNIYGSPPAYIAGGSWTYWLTLTRIGTLVTLKIYSNQAKTILVSQTSLTLTSGYDNSFTYIHPMWWDYNSYSITGYVDDVILRKYASPEPTFGVTGVKESPICSTTTKNIGDILTLNATPIQGVAPYTVEFRRANSENMVNIIDTANINSETYIIPIGRLGGLSNPVYDVIEGTMTTRLYTIDITDINDATSKIPGEGSSLLFATKMLDSCTPSQSCVKYCKVFVACSVPICDFVVT